MAKQYYGLDRGETEFNVVTNSSTVSKGVELVIDLAQNPTRQEVLEMADAIVNYLLKTNWPPA